MSWDAVYHIFFGRHEDLYKPLVFLTYALEYKFFGLFPFIYHLNNYILHLLNTALVFWFVWRLTSGSRWVAFGTALLFGIHPMHVESVAWVTERKDVLVGFFYFGCLVAYCYWQERRRKRYYVIAWVSLFLSFLAKPMGVVIPFLLLWMDWYRGRKWTRAVIVEKLPFLALSVFFGAYNVYLHTELGKMKQIFGVLPGESFLVACHGILFYCGKLFAPFQLSAFYMNPPRVGGFLPPGHYAAPLVVGTLLIAVVYSVRLTRIAAFGTGFFLLTLFPTLQLISTDAMMVVADRYTYIPYVGLFMMLTTFITWAYRTLPRLLKPLWVLGISAYVIFFAVAAWGRCADWKDGYTLWTSSFRHMRKEPTAVLFVLEGMLDRGWFDRAIADFPQELRETPAFGTAYFKRGLSFLKLKRFNEALEDFTTAIQKDPGLVSAYLNRGFVYDQLDQPEKAIADFTTAIEHDPEYALAYANRGHVYYKKLQNNEAALKDYNKAVELKAKNPGVYNNRGALYAEIGEPQKAIADYTQSIALLYGYAVPHFNRGLLYMEAGQYRRAIGDFERVVRFAPRFGGGYVMLSHCYAMQSKWQKALKPLNQLISSRPDYTRAYSARGNILYELKEYAAAAADFEKVVEIAPGHAWSHYRLGVIYEKLGRISQAREEWALAYRLEPKLVRASSSLMQNIAPDIAGLDARISRTPADPELFYWKGNLYADALQWEEALENFNEAIRLNPKFVSAYNDRGAVYLEMGRSAEALKDYNRVLELDPSMKTARLNREWLLENSRP